MLLMNGSKSAGMMAATVSCSGHDVKIGSAVGDGRLCIMRYRRDYLQDA
jgi:hypothetical protein